jgi:acyl carrier protein
MTIEEVLAVVSEETGQRVNQDTELKDLGLDSLEFLELILSVSTKCGEIADSAVPSINTVNDLYLAASGILI